MIHHPPTNLNKENSKTIDVLFICTGNFYRSRYAEAYFNCAARWSQSPHWAVSRGFRIDPEIGPISTYTLTRMVERGIDAKLVENKAKMLYSGDIDRADIAICMYEKEHKPMAELFFESLEHRIIYWDIPDIDENPPNKTLDLIEKNVDNLLHTIHDKKWKDRNR